MHPSHRAQALLGEYLASDETVLWFGQPDRRVHLAHADIFLIPFSLAMLGFTLLWEYSVVAALLNGETRADNGGYLWMFAVLGAVMITFMLYFVFGRFIFKYVRKTNTYYAVTDQRVLVVADMFGLHLNQVGLAEVPLVEKSANASGLGWVRFGRMPFWSRHGNYNTGLDAFFDSREPPAFYDIWEVDTVCELVNDQKEG